MTSAIALLIPSNRKSGTHGSIVFILDQNLEVVSVCLCLLGVTVMGKTSNIPITAIISTIPIGIFSIDSQPFTMFIFWR